MYSLMTKYLDALRFDNAQLSTLKMIGEYRGKQALYNQQTPELLESLKQAAFIESSESSNRIEGITAPHHRIEKIVLHSTEPETRSEQEIAGYRDALALTHESAKQMNFTVDIILQLHGMLYRYLPTQGGRWKSKDNEIIEKNSDGTIKRVRFTPPAAVLTEQAMEDLIEGYEQITSLEHYEPLVILPLIILDFLCIHPFTDGNGCTARILTSLLLYHYDYDVGRYISLERIFEESKETYYEALEKSSINWHKQKHDPFPWLNYFWGALLRAYSEFEERVGTIKGGKGYKTEQINIAVASHIGSFSISEIEGVCPGVSRDMIRHVLRQMRDQGKLKTTGTGRSAKWHKTN